MNILVLKFLVEERQHLIEERLVGTKYNSAATIGVAKLLIGNGGDTSVLSAAQLYHYEAFIKPLLFVECEGPMGYIDDDMQRTSCVHGTHIDDESLLLCYLSHPG